MSEPDLYLYTDYRKFIEDWLAAKKGRLSQRGLAQKVGCSHSLMSSIIGGTRDLGAPYVERTMDALRLQGAAREYFGLLVQLEGSQTPAEKKEVRERIRAAQHLKAAERIVEKKLLVFTHWYYPAIVELARCAGFQSDPAWIANALSPRITEEQAAEALSVLIDIGFLVERGGRLVPDVPISATDTEVRRSVGSALVHLHRTLLVRAGEALDTFPKDERHFGTLCLAVPVSRVPELKQMITRFEQELIGRFAATDAPDRVVQIGFQMYPLSRVTEG
jgi:uncharacterized protein (TIGR02147 family)